MLSSMRNVALARTSKVAHDKVRANKRGVTPVLLMNIHCVSHSVNAGE